MKPYVLWDRNIFPAENAVQGLLGYSLREYCIVIQRGSKSKKKTPRELQLNLNIFRKSKRIYKVRSSLSPTVMRKKATLQ